MDRVATTGRPRLRPEDRRQQLIGIGLRLLTSTPIHELSVDDVAAEAGISRSLLFHYFPTKGDYYRAVVRAAGDRFVAACSPDAGLPPERRLAAMIDGLIDFVERRRDSYLAFIRGAGADPLLMQGTEEARDRLVELTLAALGRPATPLDELKVRGWLAYAQELVARWATHRQIGRDELRALLIEALPRLLAPPTP